MSPESSAIEGGFKPWPFQTGIVDAMSCDDIEKVTVRKSSRVGYSKLHSLNTAYKLTVKRRNCLIFCPTDGQAKKYTKKTIDPLLRDAPSFREALRGSGRNSKENTLETKFFIGCSLDVRGGHSPDSYRADTMDEVTYDELAAFELNIGHEGSPTFLGDKRTFESPHSKSIRGSSPTRDGVCQIQKSEEEADLVFRFKMPCPTCGVRQHYEWGGKDVAHGIKWEDRDANTAHYVCCNGECGARWEFKDAKEIQSRGRWEAETGEYIVEGEDQYYLANEDGEKIPWPSHVGFVVWAAYNLLVPWSKLVTEWFKAQKDPESLQSFINTTLGEFYKDTLVEVDAEPLYKARQPWILGPEWIRMIAVGADLQPDRAELTFVGYGPNEVSAALYHLVLHGDSQDPDHYTAIIEELRKPIKLADGRELRPLLCCFDSGYQANQVYGLSRRAGVKFVIPTKGLSTYGAPIVTMPRKPHKEHHVFLSQIGTDTAKEAIYQRLMLPLFDKQGNPTPASIHFPEIDGVFDMEYFNQLTGEEKRPVIHRGRKILAFQQAYPQVEALDCMVGALAAVKIAQSRFRIDLSAPLSHQPERKKIHRPGTGTGDATPQQKSEPAARPESADSPATKKPKVKAKRLGDIASRLNR